MFTPHVIDTGIGHGPRIKKAGAWVDTDFHEWANGGGVFPYAPELVVSNSIDLRVGNTVRYPHTAVSSAWAQLNWRKRQARGLIPLSEKEPDFRWKDPAPFDMILLRRGQFVLLDTAEYIAMPPDVVGELWTKSTPARNGVQQIHSGIVEGGFCGTLTLELVNHHPLPVAIVSGLPLVQLVVYQCTAVPEQPYNKRGRYMGQSGPEPARPPKGN